MNDETDKPTNARKHSDASVRTGDIPVETAQFTLDQDGRFVNASDSLCRLLGYTREELMSRKVTDINPNFPMDRWREHWEEVRRLKMLTFITEHRTKSGQLLPVKMHRCFVQVAGEELLWAHALYADEQELHSILTGNLVNLVEQCHDAIITFGLDGTIQNWNASAGRIFGYSSAEMIGSHISRLAPPDLQEEPRRLIEGLLEGEPANAVETIRRHKDGRLIEVSIRHTPLHDNGGNIVAVFGIARESSPNEREYADLVELNERLRKRAALRAKQLQQSRESLQLQIEKHKASEDELRLRLAAIETVNDGILITDARLPDNPIIFVNSRFLELTGYSEAEVLDQNCRFLQGPATDPATVA